MNSMYRAFYYLAPGGAEKELRQDKPKTNDANSLLHTVSSMPSF